MRIIAINNIVSWCNYKNEIINNNDVEMLERDVINDVFEMKRIRES